MTDDVTEERTRLMATGNRLLAQSQEHYAADRMDEALRLWKELDKINARYRELLPEVTVARCPDTGERVRWPIDTMGLDGWFWSYFKRISRLPQPPPATWQAMTGAMRLADPVEHTLDFVVPGPGAPFVLPRLLTTPGVRAVLAEVPVGRHTGWAITYFGPETGPLIDLWGTNSHPVYRRGQPIGWSANGLRAAEFDFELTGWLRKGVLLWLEPGSETLRAGVRGCPFVNLPGPHEIAVLFGGKVTYTDAAPVG